MEFTMRTRPPPPPYLLRDGKQVGVGGVGRVAVQERVSLGAAALDAANLTTHNLVKLVK